MNHKQLEDLFKSKNNFNIVLRILKNNIKNENITEKYLKNVMNDIFPFDTNGQIWGTPAVGDLDLDGYNDVVFVSKSKNIYVFDLNGLKWSYETQSQLIGTPTICNINTNIIDLYY